MNQDILCAEPLELVVMLYKGLRTSIQEARRQLAVNDIAGRSQSVSRAMGIVGELASALALDRGGEMAAGLHQLYSFLADRLLDGNYRQVDGPLAEAEAVTETLLEAWTAICPSSGNAAVESYAAPVAIYSNSLYDAEPPMESSYLRQRYG